MDYNYKSLLTMATIYEILNGDLLDISNVTKIPLSTLKNYKNGVSNLENMPYHMIESLTSYSDSQYDPFSYSTHYFLRGDLFSRLLKEVRPEYNQIAEVYEAQMLFNYANERFLTDASFKPSIRYFFIESLDKLLETNVPEINFDLLFSVGLIQGIRFVINIDHVSDSKKYIQNKEGIVLSGNLVKKITRDKLDQMRTISDVKEFMVLDDEVLLDKNVKLWLLYDLYHTNSDSNDYLDFNIVLNFIKDSTDEQLVGFIMSTHDEQEVYLRNYVDNNEMYRLLFSAMVIMKDSIVKIIHSYFDDKTYESFVAHYV